MNRVASIWVVGLLASAVGFALGRATAPAPPTTPAPTQRVADTESGPHAEAGQASDAGAPIPIDRESLEGFLGMGKRAISFGADPNALVRVAVDEMSDDQLISLITSLTDYERDELEDVQDMRAFVNRLADIALDGTLVPAENLPPDLAHIEFALEVQADNSAVDPTARFRSDDSRIYAVFETDELGGEEVFAKWVRAEDGEVLLFGRYRIEPGDDFSYVWLDRPGSTWEPGSYRVDFYTSDENLDLLASGSHVISQ